MTLFYIKDETTGRFFNSGSPTFKPMSRSRTVARKDNLHWKFGQYCRRVITAGVNNPYRTFTLDPSYRQETFDALIDHEFRWYINDHDVPEDFVDMKEIFRMFIDPRDISWISSSANFPMFQDVVRGLPLGRYFRTKDKNIDPGPVYGLRQHLRDGRSSTARFLTSLMISKMRTMKFFSRCQLICLNWRK